MAQRSEQVFKAVVNDTDPKSEGKSYAIDISGSNYNHFLGKKIGDVVDGIFVGDGDISLGGFKLQIRGGSDLTGTPMRADLTCHTSLTGLAASLDEDHDAESPASQPGTA